MNKLGTRLKQLREERGYSQQQLADSLHLSRSTIEMYEHGKRDPNTETKEAIADFFNVNMDYLFGREKISPADSGEILVKDERILLDMYRSLNAAGKRRIIEYAEMIMGRGEYVKGEDLELSNKVC